MTQVLPSDLLLLAPLKFLGATVLGFNANLGIGVASSSLNVNMVIDCEAGDYFAPKLSNNDPRYVEVGSAVYFRIYKPAPSDDPTQLCSLPPDRIVFQFCGVLTSWNLNKSSAGITYSARIEDPRGLFDNVAVIIDSYSDKYNRYGDPFMGNIIVDINTIYDKLNYINVYQHFESAVHDGDCSKFGTSYVLENAGMPYNQIVQGLSELDMPIYSSTYNPNSVTSQASKVYYIRWSDLRFNNIPLFFRIPGPKITLSDLCREIADFIGAEYYVYLEQDPICSGRNYIRIGFINLSNNPPSFDQLIESYDTQGISTDLSYGQELRLEKTKTILVGDPVHRMVTYPDVIPFFGLEDDVVPIIPIGYDANGFYIEKKFRLINAQLNVPIPDTPLLLHELDIRAAMASCDAWLDRVFDDTIGDGDSLNGVIRGVFGQCIASNRNYWNSIANNAAFNGLSVAATQRAIVDVLQNPKKGKVEAFRPGIIDDLEKIHHAVKSLGDTYYGKQYLVPLASIIQDPQNSLIMCGYQNIYDTINGEWVFTAEPTAEGAWLDYGDQVLGLTDPYLEMFRNEDGRLNAFARFVGGSCGLLDLSYISDDEAIALDEQVWVKADIDPKMVMLPQDINPYLNRLIQSYNLPGVRGTYVLPCVIFKFNSPCLTACDGVWNPGQWAFTVATNLIPIEQAAANNAGDGANKDKDAKKAGTADVVDHTSLNNRGWQPSAMRPKGVAIPMRYNNQLYGPWGSSGCFLDGGGVEFISQPGLNPWTYGSTNIMTIVGSGLVATMNKGLLRSETGSVTLLGLPSVGNLGAALNSVGPILSTINFNYGSNGVTSTSEYRTYSPKFGTLSKVYLDRFKEYATQRKEFIRKIKNAMISLHKTSRHIQLAKMGVNRNSIARFQARESSLQRVLISQLNRTYDGGEYYQTRTGAETLYKTNAEMLFDYNKKSYMSFDAFFGPTDTIPEILTRDQLAPSFPASYSKAPQPPSWKGSVSPLGPSGVTGPPDNHGLPIMAGNLFPLTGPNQLTERTDNAAHKGHAIDLVGRDDTVPQDGLLNNILEQDDPRKYTNDYRYISMRGPIMLTSWGYDTHGVPIPNIQDDGTLSDTSFSPNWLQKPQLWPTAPIDLRYDRDRKVWVSPPAHRIISAQLIETLEPTSTAYAVGKIIDNGDDPDGPDYTIVFKNPVECRIPSGTKVYAYYDTYDGYYIALTKCSG